MALDFAVWAYALCRDLKGLDRPTRDQLLRASQSIALNIAEGCGKIPPAERGRYLQIASGSAREYGRNPDVARFMDWPICADIGQVAARNAQRQGLWDSGEEYYWTARRYRTGRRVSGIYETAHTVCAVRYVPRYRCRVGRGASPRHRAAHRIARLTGQ